jgi:hypothetical protein
MTVNLDLSAHFRHLDQQEDKGDELYSGYVCGTRKKVVVFQRIISYFGILPLMLMLETVMGFSMLYSLPPMAYDLASACRACGLDYGTDLASLAADEAKFNYHCLSDQIKGMMYGSYSAYMQAFVTSLAAHVLVLFSIIIDRSRVSDETKAQGLSRTSNKWHLAAYCVLALDLLMQIADVFFIQEAVWGDSMSSDGYIYPNDSYLFTESDGYAVCVPQEVTQVRDMSTLLYSSSMFIWGERTIFAVIIIACYHIAKSNRASKATGKSRREKGNDDGDDHAVVAAATTEEECAGGDNNQKSWHLI